MSGDSERESDDSGESPENDQQPNVAERYRKIFEYNNDAVMVVDIENEEFVDVNPKACELLGYSRSELLSLNPEEIHPTDIDRVRNEFITEVTEKGAGFTDDLTCLTKHGREIPTEISGAVIESANTESRPTRMVAMLRDISDRVQHQQELEQKIKRLSRFANIVSHDLKSPLSVIMGHTTLARETGDPEHFDAIENAAARMDEMLSELLELTKEGELIGTRTEIDLESFAREVWNDCEIDSASLDVQSSLTIYGDRDRLHELFANLFENAHSHGGSAVSVRVGALKTEDREGFYIEDDGTGIPADKRDNIFEWGHTTTEEGTGYGLAIAAEIVEAHGWKIDVTGSDVGGIRFEISQI